MDYIDMLAKLGANSAHPGGFTATLEQLVKYPLPASGRVLEVGCGTGQTACHLAGLGYEVTAVDLHASMVEKTRRRATDSGLAVRALVADICRLPFEDEQFDCVIIESVTNFTNASVALNECLRILKPGGIIYDRELMVEAGIPEEALNEITQFFRMPQIMSREQWTELMEKLGPASYEFLEYDAMDVVGSHPAASKQPSMEYVDEGAFADLSVWQTAIRYDEVIMNNLNHLRYGLLKITK
jgi:ubiquinone/menaquinone biosynthesis C-methylase UbiE